MVRDYFEKLYDVPDASADSAGAVAAPAEDIGPSPAPGPESSAPGSSAPPAERKERRSGVPSGRKSA
jgi:hypothetical protein